MNAKQNTDLLPAYLIVGEDALKRDAVLARLRARLEKLGDLSFNSDEFLGDVAAGESIVTACNTIPFASEKRLVLVRGAEKLKKADSEQVVAYLTSPSPTSVLALEAEKLAKNTRLYKAIAALGKTAVIDCAPPKSYELPRQVRSMAVGCGVTFTEGAAAKLVELVGDDTVHLNSEIKKIALAHRGTDAVNENEVLSLVACTAEVKPWDFVNAFSSRDLAKCMRFWRVVKTTSPHALIAMCTVRIRELMCAQSLMRRGSIAQLPRALSQPDWRVKNHGTWARQFKPAELRAALCSARDAERAMKSGANPEATFRDWVVATLKRS